MPDPFTAETSACREAQSRWAERDVRERLGFIRRLRHRLVASVEALGCAVEADVRRRPGELLATDLLPTASALRFLERRAVRLLSPRRVPARDRPLWLWGSREAVHRRPWGVIGLIGTWNYPILLNVVPLAQALTAGNGVVWKPSEQTPRTAQALQELFALFPPGLVQVLPATREAGPLLAEADIDLLLFVGSDQVGRRLATRLGERLIPSILELSGCDAMVVRADADLALAAQAAWFSTTLNHGQTCIATRRIFVAQSCYEAFLHQLRQVVDQARANSPGEGERLQTPAQARQAQQLIADALARGAALLSEAPLNAPAPGDDATIPPTFLINATADLQICQQACFAPLAAVIPVADDDEAVRLVNASPLALAASVFSADVPRARELAARLRVGSVTVNDTVVTTAHPALPFGGRGASGWGVTRGEEGLIALTVPQTLSVRTGRLRPHFSESIQPNPHTLTLLTGWLKLAHAQTLRERLSGLGQMWRALRGRG